MPQTGFLFVNKDAKSGSLSRTTAGEKSSINRHVQRARKYGKLDLNATEKPRFGFAFRRKSEVQASSEDDFGNLARVQGLAARPEQDFNHQTSSETASIQSHSDPTDNHSIVQQQLSKAQEERLVRMICQQNTPVDPFDVQSIKLNPMVCSLLRYYLDASQTARWQIKLGRHRKMSDEGQLVSAELIRGCLQSDVTMYTTLAAMATLRINQEAVPLQSYANLYIHNAILATREHLSSSPAIDARLIRNLFHLCLAEWFARKYEASVIHLRLVKQLVDQAGGWRNLNQDVMKVVILGDGMFAAEKLTLPVFTADFDPGRDLEIMTWLSRTNQHSTLGKRLLHPAHIEIVPEMLHELIIDLAECVSVQTAHSEDQADAPPNILGWIEIRNLALRHRLLTITSFDPRTYALRVALLMWVIYFLFVSGRKLVIRVLAPKLHEILYGIDKGRWRGHEPILVWVMSIGAISAVNDSPLQRWFDKEIVELLQTGKVTMRHMPPSEQDLLDFSETFFYIASLQKPMLQRLAKTIRDTMALVDRQRQFLKGIR